MSDNTIIPPGAGGDTIRTMDRVTAKTQVVGLDFGADAGPEKLVAIANGLPVQPATGASFAVTGTFFQATQPVSGTVTANQGGAPWASNWTQYNGVANGAGNAAFVQPGTAATFTVAQAVAANLNATVTGTVITTPPANASTNVTQFGGAAVVTGTGASGAGVPRVTVSNDSVILAAQSGAWSVGRSWTLSSGTDSVAIAGAVTVTGIPPLGNAPSTGALPVVIASDQVVPVQFNPDAFGPAGMDTALPVTLALDQPPVQVVQTQLGQQLMAQSVPVTLAMDQTSVVVTANQGVSPFNIAGPVSVTNFPGVQPVSGTVAVSNLPTTQAVSAAALPLPANAAIETGGNLAALVTLTQQMQQLIEINKMMLATLKADNIMLASLAGASVNPSDMLDDVTFQ